MDWFSKQIYQFDTNMDVFIIQNSVAKIDGIYWNISPDQVLQQLQSFTPDEDTINLRVYDINIKEENNEMIQEIFQRIASYNWWSAQFIKCTIPDCYFSVFDQYLQMRYLHFYNTSICNPNIRLSQLTQLTLTDTEIRRGDGSFLKRLPRLQYVYTGNKEDEEFLSQKIDEFSLQVELRSSKIFK